MICGHIGVAMGARALNRDVPLGWLLAGSVAPDVLDGIESFARVCSPEGLYSHSLPAILALMIVLSTAAFLHLGRVRAAMLVGLMVLLHVLPDYVTGQKLLWANGPLIGLDVYQWPLLDFALEVPVIVFGWWLLRRAAIDARWITSVAMLALLIAVQAGFNESQRSGDHATSSPTCARRHHHRRFAMEPG
jgi:hypothetical protein